LDSLGSAQDIVDTFITFMLLQKLDVATQTSWEEITTTKDKIPFEKKFYEILQNQCRKL